MARAKLEIGGKYNNQIVFRGNKKFLPAHLRGIINAYFNNWNSLKDISSYPQLIGELGEAGADRVFLGTDWEKLNELHQQHMQRFTLGFHGRIIKDDKVELRIACPYGKPAKPLEAILTEYASPEGILHDNFDLWRVDKLLRRAKATLHADQSFTAALKVFARRAVSLEESVSFFRQVQAYHMEQFIAPELKTILAGYIDVVHTLKKPTQLAELGARLHEAKANLRIHPSVKPVVDHVERLARAALPFDDDALAKDDPRIAVQLQDRLNASLFPFQREGVAFLSVNGRALLADDMGLGKTLQSMAGALVLKAQGKVKRVLVVCPSSLKYQWQSEIQRFTNERCEVIGGDKQERMDIYRSAQSGGTLVGGEDRPLFYIINYELVHRDLEHLKKLDAQLLILDEAQRVKNFRTKTAQAVFELPVRYAFVLTGTPLENQLMELYTIVRFIDDRTLGRNPVAFRDRYVVTDRFGGIIGYRHVEEVTRKIAAVTLRRTRKQALEQLPPLMENNIRLDLTDIQRRIYRELEGQAREVLSDSAWDTIKANNALTLLQRLREVCDTPELIDGQYKDSQKLTEYLSCIEDEVRTLDRQIITFTQWTRMGEILVRELNTIGIEPCFLHGGLKAADRQQMVEDFNAGKYRVFISTDAGGTGLNLQAASMVINYDLPFNPAKLNQRIARAHRLGQEQTVFVVNLLCRNTVEEKLLKILLDKQNLFDDVFGDISDQSLSRVSTSGQRSLRELLFELIR